MTQEMELEIFRAGDYGLKGQWSEQDLDQIANSYDPNLHEAPVTLDHAQSGPSLGWVAGVQRKGDRLVARLRGLNDRLVEMLRSGEFKKRSVELYGTMPESGGPYLKAVSFLGAATPAVKGLRDLIFAEGGSNAPQQPDDSLEFEKLDFEFSTHPSPAPAARFNSSFADAIHQQFSELKHSLQQTGIWRPSWEQQGIELFFGALAQFDEVASASDPQNGDTIHPTEWFGQFLRSLSPHVAMGESAGHRPTTDTLAGRLPRDGNVSPDSIKRHRRAVALCESQPGLSYSEALARS